MLRARADRYRLLILTLLLATAAAQAELPPLTRGLTPIEPNAAPSLRLPDLDGKLLNIGQLRGKVVVVNFWTTWCPPCRREMPSLERLKQAAGDAGIAVLAVNIGEDAETVFAFTGTIDPAPTFPLLLDLQATTLSAWNVQGLPTTFVVAPDGRLAYRAVGGREFDHPEIVQRLRELAAKP